MSLPAQARPSAPAGQFVLPLRLQQRASRPAAASRLVLVAFLVGLATLPIAGLAVAGPEPQVLLAALVERPLASLQIAVGFALVAALVLVPAWRLIQRVVRTREILVAGGMVEIVDRGIGGTRRRRIPIGDYQGVAHHIRASVAGLTHEIVLVHRKSQLTVTLVAADRVTQSMLDEAKAVMGLPEVPARAIYERRQRHSDAAHAATPSLAGA